MNKKNRATPTNKTTQMCRFISLLIGIQGLLMAVVNGKNGNIVQTIIPLIYGSLMIINFIYIRYSKKLSFFYFSASLVIFGLEYSFLKNGGTDGFGIIWLTVIPLFTVYLLDTLFYNIINATFSLILIVAMWTPLSSSFYNYNQTFRVRFPFVYLLTFFFGIFLKYRISRTEKELEIQKNLLSTEIHQAALIQQTFFTQKQTDFSDWQIAIKNIPMAEVSGDMYDIYTENGKLQGLGLFDISGHGISSGLITMLTKSIIHQEFLSHINKDLETAVNAINSRITEEKGDIENYLTGILIRTFKDHIELVNAGHQFPLIYKAEDMSISIFNKDPSAIGAIGMKYLPGVYITQTVNMKSGDEIILYTDGLLECKNENNELYGNERLRNSLKKVADIDPQKQVEFIESELKQFANGTLQSDDMTIVILKKK